MPKLVTGYERQQTKNLIIEHTSHLIYIKKEFKVLLWRILLEQLGLERENSIRVFLQRSMPI